MNKQLTTTICKDHLPKEPLSHYYSPIILVFDIEKATITNCWLLITCVTKQ